MGEVLLLLPSMKEQLSLFAGQNSKHVLQASGKWISSDRSHELAKNHICSNSLRNPGIGLFQQLSIKTMSFVTRSHFNLVQNEGDGYLQWCFLGYVSKESRLVRFFAWPVRMCVCVCLSDK